MHRRDRNMEVFGDGAHGRMALALMLDDVGEDFFLSVRQTNQLSKFSHVSMRRGPTIL